MNVLTAPVTAVQLFLADGGDSPADVDPTTGHGPEWGKAGPFGLLTIVLLCVALYFLVKSMNRNLKKVPESFSPSAEVSVGAGAESADGSAGAVGAGPAGATGTGGGLPPADPATPAPPAQTNTSGG